MNSAPDAPVRFQQLRSAYEALLAGGGAAQRPWWRGRWLGQLRGLHDYVREKLAWRREKRPQAASTQAQAVSEAEAQAAAYAEAEYKRRRVEVCLA